MKHIFVINPAAGKGKRLSALLSSITYACEEMEADYEIYHTATVGDGTRFVRAACEKYADLPKRFYACGGDGTLYEVLNGAVGYELTEIAVIPMGTGNDFIKTFTNPEYFRDVKRQMLGKAERIDLLKYRDRYSINVINLGFDCDVVQRVSEIKHHFLVPSGMAYAMSVADLFMKPFGKSFKVLIDDMELVEKEFMLCAVANGHYYGDGYHCAPKALLNDGKMDLILVEKVSRGEFLKLVPKYKKGEHLDAEGNSIHPCLRYQKCEKLVIQSKHPIGLCADGEISPVKTVEITCVPSAISFSIPRGSFCTALEKKKAGV